ncbi:hypothetical protein YC2023_095998 [Brassica napus]
MEESKIIFQEDKLLSGQVKLKEDEYLPKECFITNLRIETKENDKKPPIRIQQKQSEWRGIGKSANFDPNYFSRAKYDPNN